MKTMWLIQSSGLSSYHPHLNLEILKKLKLSFKDFGLISNTTEITNIENILEENTKYILRGGTKLLTILNNVNNISELCPHLSEEQIKLSEIYLNALKSSIFYDIEKFDQNNYKNLELPLLNNSAQYLQVKEILDKSFDKNMFIKPSRDLKAFNGGIIEKGLTVKEFIENSYHQNFYKDEIVILSDLKTIYSEYRFFIVNKEVITGSQYKLGDKFHLTNYIDNSIYKVAKEYALLYQPDDIFTMDICETSEGYKIVEYNCFNASGLYHSDGVKLFHIINEYILNKK
jgi:hypothetical protein